MKLGISYSLFDGEELLEGSIKQIRECADYISVIFQKVSNFGYECSPESLNVLKNLKTKGFVDDVFLFTPDLTIANHNEVIKRNIGLEKSKEAGCTHHMCMDADEYFITEQFIKIKNIINKHNFDATFCQMQTYYKDWCYVFETPESYYVPLIYKIKPESKFIYGYPQVVNVDPSRGIYGVTNPAVFKRETIEMHHGSYIRMNGIKEKLTNSSAKVNFSKDINKLVEYYDNWRYPQQAYCAGLPSWYANLIQIKPLF